MNYRPSGGHTKAVLHESFHSGTIGDSTQLRTFAKGCKEKNIPIYLTGLSNSEAVYSSVEKYAELGITALPECSVISQYCKLWLSVCNKLSINEIMKLNISGEYI